MSMLKSIHNREYTLTNHLGSGSFGEVRTAFRDDGKEFAYKEFEREEDGDIAIGILREISIMNMFKNKTNGYITDLEDMIFTEGKVGIIMKKYHTDLRTAIDGKYLTRKNKDLIAKGILRAVAFLHANGIIHRDIKPENILLDQDFNPVIADFSLSKVFCGSDTEVTHTSDIATSTYRAPEVINEDGYCFTVDDWSVGVVLYELFTGESLYCERDKAAVNLLRDSIKKMNDNPLGRAVKGLLIEDPDERWTCSRVLESDLYKSPFSCDVVWKPSEIRDVWEEIAEVEEEYEIEKAITMWAANVYYDHTECDPRHCITLACKIYETELPYFEDYDEYIESENEILIAMNYNLFV